MKLSLVILVGIVLVSANASHKHRAAQESGQHGLKRKALHRNRHAMPSVVLPSGAVEVGPTVISPGYEHSPTNGAHGLGSWDVGYEYQTPGNAGLGHETQGGMHVGHGYSHEGQNALSGQDNQNPQYGVLGHETQGAKEHVGNGHSQEGQDGLNGQENQNLQNLGHGHIKEDEGSINVDHGHGTQGSIHVGHEFDQENQIPQYGDHIHETEGGVGHGHGPEHQGGINVGHGHNHEDQGGINVGHGHLNDHSENVYYIRVLLQKVSAVALGTLSSYPGLLDFPMMNFQLISEVNGSPFLYISKDDKYAQDLMRNTSVILFLSEAFVEGDGCYRYEFGVKDIRCRKAWLVGHTHPIEKYTDEYNLAYGALLKKVPALAKVHHQKFVLIKMDVSAVFIEGKNEKPKELSVVDYFHADLSQ